MGAYECFMQTGFVGTGHVTTMLQAKNGQKLTNFKGHLMSAKQRP